MVDQDKDTNSRHHTPETSLHDSWKTQNISPLTNQYRIDVSHYRKPERDYQSRQRLWFVLLCSMNIVGLFVCSLSFIRMSFIIVYYILMCFVLISFYSHAFYSYAFFYHTFYSPGCYSHGFNRWSLFVQHVFYYLCGNANHIYSRTAKQ